MIRSLARDPLVGVIRQAISTEIEEGRFQPGDRLPPERRYAEQLGVSRGALREAIKTLEAEGRVITRHGVGVEVANDLARPFSQTIERMLPEEIGRLRQSAEARLIIEPELAALAARHATGDEAGRLVEQARQAAGTLHQAIQNDLRFHHAVAQLAGNRILQLLLQSLAELGQQSRALTLGKFGFEKAAAQHGEIADAIRRKDAAKARTAMRHHVQKAVDDLISLQKQP